jgi:serine/threonine-protein kinase
MGAVWEGRHSSLGTRVAIKFIDAEYAESQEARTRFDNEARAAATIQSKHAIQIYDHGVSDDGKPYIVMELLNGEPLDQRIERTQRLTLQDTTRIIRQVARALQRAHERGIVHRDLKPENIFLVRTPDEDDEIAKVLDFGIAKFKRLDGMGQSGGVSSSTKTGAVLGTPFYMSPEQARGLREVDHRTDLWSLGVIAFKCVSGVLPFEGVSVGDLLVKICTSAPPIPSHVVPGLPTSFDAWFARALEREPSRRFSSAQELADALAYAAGVSVKRGSSSSADPAIPVGLSHPPTSGAAIANATERPHIASSATSAPFTASNPRAQSSSSRGVVVAAIGAALIGASLGVFAIVKISSTSKPVSKTSSLGTITFTPNGTPEAPSAAPPASAPPVVVPPPDPITALAPGAGAVVDAGAPEPETVSLKPGGKPPRGGRPIKGLVPKPGTSASASPPVTGPAPPPTTPPATPPPAPPAPKPAGTAIDPGY